MPKIASRFDPAAAEWRRVTDRSDPAYPVDFEYALLGYDLATGRLDMLLRYAPGGCHCRRHRHVAATATLVLEGEQFVTDVLPDGSLGPTIHRRQGDYALAAGDAHPHHEHGGETGGTVLLSLNAGPDGVLFEYFDAAMQNGLPLTIGEYVAAWEQGVAHGGHPAAAAAAE
ncbi:MAG: hypothetical protein KDC18_02405 [Alphaproteobacteria bacterium]|nr:hypothetical protein [Alphaproteobacteria bacterium]MCB9930241.1 hypothetical protein [Alphaproteobacteria bacterium]